MIARTWRGQATAANADAYHRHFTTSVAPHLRDIAGYQGGYLLRRETDGQVTDVKVPIERVILVGYSGRDRAAVLEHIRELETLGVAPPERVPAIYPVAPELVTTGTRLAVDAPRTSGEAEFVIVPSAAGYLVGVGSDHTDSTSRCRPIPETSTSKLDGSFWLVGICRHRPP